MAQVKTKTQLTKGFNITNGTTKVAFAHLNQRVPQDEVVDGGLYTVTFCLQKSSKDVQDFCAGYQQMAQEAMQKYNVQVPDVGSILRDGDSYNANKRVAQGKEPFDCYVNSFFIKCSSQYPIRMCDDKGYDCYALDRQGQHLKDGFTGTDAYYLPTINGSLVNFRVKFNVGFNNLKQTFFARPYVEWIQQVVPGEDYSTGPKPINSDGNTVNVYNYNFGQSPLARQQNAAPQATQPQAAPQIAQPQTNPYGMPQATPNVVPQAPVQRMPGVNPSAIPNQIPQAQPTVPNMNAYVQPQVAPQATQPQMNPYVQVPQQRQPIAPAMAPTNTTPASYGQMVQPQMASVEDPYEIPDEFFGNAPSDGDMPFEV